MPNNNQNTGISNTANIVYNGYDHKDVGCEWNDFVYGSDRDLKTTQKYFNRGLFTYFNQIMVMEDDGIVKRIWRKIYNRNFLKKESHFWVTNEFYLYYNGWPNGSTRASGFIFPDYKLFQPDVMGPYCPHGYWSGPEGNYSVRYSLLLGYLGYGYGSGNFSSYYYDANTGKDIQLDPKDYYCCFAVTPNGMDWYSTIKIKKFDHLGEKGKWVSPFIIVKGGFFYFYGRILVDSSGYKYEDNNLWISYMSFDQETKEFGDPVDFNFTLQDLYNVSRGTTLYASDNFEVDKYMFFWRSESNNGKDQYSVQERIHFIRVSPEGDVSHFYTRWYYRASVRRYLTADENMAYLLLSTTNVYVWDGSCPIMTSVVGIDKNGGIHFLTSERNIYQYIGGYYVYESYDDKLATALSGMIAVYKNDHSNWWYFYTTVRYDNKAFFKDNSTYERWIITRTTDFIHFEYYESPEEIIEYESQTKTETIKITYNTKNADPEHGIYYATMESYNPEPRGLSVLYPICLKDGKIAHSSGHFIKANPGYVDYGIQGYIYLKNYACMPKNDDTYFIMYDNEYSYNQTLLNMFNGLDYPGKDT